jgi:hypothetical protein
MASARDTSPSSKRPMRSAYRNGLPVTLLPRASWGIIEWGPVAGESDLRRATWKSIKAGKSDRHLGTSAICAFERIA